MKKRGSHLMESLSSVSCVLLSGLSLTLLAGKELLCFGFESSEPVLFINLTQLHHKSSQKLICIFLFVIFLTATYRGFQFF